LNIEPHDLPFDKPASFYQEQFAGPLKNYWSIGNDNRDTSYFLQMYLSCYRAIEYLKTRPDWNGKTLVVMGDSQGGQQTIMIAGLHPKNITAALALVPANGDTLAPEVGRAPGWPQWYFNTEGKDPQKVREASRYYDIANFARHIKCPMLVGLGLRDETCPPSSVLAVVSQIKSSREVVILPKSGHQDEHGTQAFYNRRRYDVWLPALRQGKPAPVNE
jgi:cephalosporin-C deacetylase-like acetyl esterase